MLRGELGRLVDGLASDPQVPAAALWALPDQRMDLWAESLRAAVMGWFVDNRLVSVPQWVDCATCGRKRSAVWSLDAWVCDGCGDEWFPTEPEIELMEVAG